MTDILGDIIEQMETPGSISKEAAAPASAGGLENLEQALEKTAAAPVSKPVDPVEALMVKAAQLAGADQEANKAEANMLGAALADGFLAKMAAAEQEVKVAQAHLPPVQPVQGYAATLAPLAAPLVSTLESTVDPEIEKIASVLELQDVPSMQKMAADAGYQAVMEKAAEDYRIGHDAALQEVAHGAYSEFVKGAAETEEVLRRMAARQQ